MAKKKKPTPADGEAEDVKGGKDPKMMAAGGLLVAALVYWFVLKPAPATEPAMTIGPDGQPIPAVTTTMPIVEGEIFEMPEMVLNLNDDEVAYLRIAIAVVLEEGVVAKDFEAESAIAKDILVQELSQLTAVDLEDPVRRQTIKDELSTQIRAAYGNEKVVRILITSMVMQ